MQKIIRSRAPVRISFAGGGTDVSPYTEEYGGAVLNAAINRYAYTTFIKRTDGKVILDSLDLENKLEYENISLIELDGKLDLPKAVILYFKKHHPKFFKELLTGFEIHTSCEIPPKSGLGSSAAMFTSVIGIFNKLAKEYRIDNYDIAELAYALERKELGNIGGRQDQYSSVFGGINFIEFKGNDFVKVNCMKLKQDCVLELESNLLLLNIGPREISGDILTDQVRNCQTKEKTLEATHKTKEFAYKAKYALIRGDLKQLGEFLDLGWQEKKKFSSKISNREIDNMYDKLKEAGAIGGKILGAGGGGHMLFYCKPGKKLHVLKEAVALGLKEVSFTFDYDGLTTWTTNNLYYYNNERKHSVPNKRKSESNRLIHA